MPRKLIEVSIPLTHINDAAVAEKKIKSGYPANIHMWWARRPLAASRAVIFAQLVDDPSAHPDRFPTAEAVEAERERLFKIMRALVEPTGPSDEVLRAAQLEIGRAFPDGVTVLDPFAGGGSIPIEAQRLGLDVGSSDLNPVAVLLNRVLLDQVRSALDRTPAHIDDSLLAAPPGRGLSGLSADLVAYGMELRNSVEKRIGSFFPPAIDGDGNAHTVVSWLWAREISCSNPGCQARVPLLASLWLSKKADRRTWLEPKVDKANKTVRFVVTTGNTGPTGKPSKTGRGPKFSCYICEQALSESYTHEQVDQHRFTYRLLAVAALGDRRRIYFDGDSQPQIEVGAQAPDEVAVPCRGTFASNAQGRRYGFITFGDYFTERQLLALRTLSDCLPEIRERVRQDTDGDEDYAILIVTLLALCVSKLADMANALCAWEPQAECPRHLFSRQAIPMVWDFAEGNPLGESSGSFMTIVENTARSLRGSLVEYPRRGKVDVSQANAVTREYPPSVVICTDPPYFDNIGYADLSDFFYVWLRHSLKDVHPDLFGTMLTPKVDELVAAPFRFDGDEQAAHKHFESGFREVFSRIEERHHQEVPMTVFYAYKQEDDENSEDGIGSGAGATGWEKLLQGMVDSGIQVTATWPIRTEMAARMVGRGANALASSVVLACRPRPADAGITDRQGFIRELRRELSAKLHELQSGGVQPVDMAQASIGPGMAVFTSYTKVVEAGDRQMTVGSALQIINRILDELQTDQESEFDADTRWAVSWFEQHGMNAGDFGDALNLATARGTAMNALERSGILEARAGRVRLLNRDEYPDNWDPKTDNRLTVWEVCQHLIRRVQGDGGLMAAAALLRQVGGLGDAARDLAYRLYEIANRNGWSDEARAYNNLAAEWPDLVALSAQEAADPTTLF